MINENMDVFLRARMTDFLDRINIYIARVDKENHKLQFVEDIEFSTEQDGLTIVPPTLSLSEENGQALMDELWKCGLRPTEGKGSAGSLAATEQHLQDFRKIAFKFLEL